MKNIKPPPPHNFRVNRAKSALTALFLLLALASAALMRGHATAPTNPAPENPEPSYTITLSPPAGWYGWEPTATETITFTAITDATSPEGSIKFDLSPVTSHEGRYMNDSDSADHEGNDLYFASQQSGGFMWRDHVKKDGEETITAHWKNPERNNGLIEIPIDIVCNDYAAYGEIQATLNVPTFPSVTTESQTIPKDDGISFFIEFNPYGGPEVPAWGGVANNKLADAWDVNHAYWCDWFTCGMDLGIAYTFSADQTGLDRDEGYNGSGANSGDGLTVFEEYRGFYVGGSHTRLNPEVKDLFIRSEINEIDGVGETGNAYGFGLSVHSIKADECFIDTENPSDPVVNFCMGGSLTAVWVAEPATEDERAKISGGTLAYLKSGTRRCVIGIDAVNASVAFSLSSAIGHEVGHAIGLKHHWPRTAKRAVPGNLISSSFPVPVIDFPTENTDACTMMTLENVIHISHQLRLDINSRWSNADWADFHNTPPDGGEDWEDHWRVYQLHGREGRLTYD